MAQGIGEKEFNISLRVGFCLEYEHREYKMYMCVETASKIKNCPSQRLRLRPYIALHMSTLDRLKIGPMQEVSINGGGGQKKHLINPCMHNGLKKG